MVGESRAVGIVIRSGTGVNGRGGSEGGRIGRVSGVRMGRGAVEVEWLLRVLRLIVSSVGEIARLKLSRRCRSPHLARSVVGKPHDTIRVSHLRVRVVLVLVVVVVQVGGRVLDRWVIER